MLSIITKFNVFIEAVAHRKYAPNLKEDIFELADCTISSVEDLEHKLSMVVAN
jgi:hypothetical protein